MGAPLSWLAWYATRASHRRVRVAFGLGPLGRQALANLVAEAMQDAEAKTDVRQKCVWCERPILPGQPTTELGGLLLHTAPCLSELDAVTCGRTAKRDMGHGGRGPTGRRS